MLQWRTNGAGADDGGHRVMVDFGGAIEAKRLGLTSQHTDIISEVKPSIHSYIHPLIHPCMYGWKEGWRDKGGGRWEDG